MKSFCQLSRYKPEGTVQRNGILIYLAYKNRATQATFDPTLRFFRSSNLAYEGLRKNHMPGGLMSKAGYEHNTCIGGGIEHYIEKGYVPLGIRAHALHCDGPALIWLTSSFMPVPPTSHKNGYAPLSNRPNPTSHPTVDTVATKIKGKWAHLMS
jgi:hypothetical protein